jgi:release factor glutamine methyltransferase
MQMQNESRTASPPPVWTVREVLRWVSGRFGTADLPTPLLDAQILLGHVTGLSRIQLYTEMDRPLSQGERATLREHVRRRLSGEPVAYLLGRKDWHDLSLYVDPRVLIPRPETESLLDFVLEVFKSADKAPSHILDVCTGSGCLAVALAKKFPKARVFAVDISEESMEVAKLNAQSNGVSNIEFLLGDVTRLPVFEYLRKQSAPFDIITANPPYVSESEWQQCDVSVKNFEPKLALTADEDGLKIARLVYEHLQTSEALSAQSVFAMEVGLGQCQRLHQRFSPTEPFVSFANSHAVWRLPRGFPFALQDLTNRERFWCQIRGLDYAVAPTLSQLETPSPTEGETK